MSCLTSLLPVARAHTTHGARLTPRRSSRTLAASHHRSHVMGRPGVGGAPRLSLRVARGLVVRRAEESDDAAEEEAGADGADSPINAAEALEWGQTKFAEGDHQRAVDLFREVFTLPGSGSMRYKGTIREISCASEGEENAALYNIACAYAKMGDSKMCMQALSDCLSNGFNSFEAMKTDPDLASVRNTAEFAALTLRYDSPVANLFGKKKSDGKKGWMERW